MSQQQLKVAVTKPQEAIQEYLDGLLQDATARALMLDEAVAPQEVVEVVKEVELPTPSLEITPQVKEEPVAVVESAPTAIGRPEWSRQRFECLLFKVAGLKLAVPLIELGTIYPLDEPLTPLFGQPDWFLGLYKHTGKSIRVMDAAKWVMPERYSPELNEGLKYIISLKGCDWALAVHDVAEAIQLDPDAVRWRTERGKRPWLAGTVIGEMCALLDVERLSSLICEAESNGNAMRAN
ncbi:CheW domain-containing protein [Aestuariirhabdus litorea]|uniref:Chemotaxis protein CheW n=1 Tax=Aestuariirhabdus litorea TaxID=2528527 RepID=A0A3P3VW74_9GAMM|nr:CheW domain-containing protein [Aestuariirhabdus litorea]RRJ84973.1 chemotaxis protein CheW [Aestuariirhabdus litorea]RWW98197.1 chemotaxis protein CheW [Endozoicomonadaceae bacterium GTF-13]